MTAAALIPLSIFAIVILLMVVAVFGIANAKQDEHEDEAATVWLPEAVSCPVEAPPAANVIRMPTRLHVIKGGRA